MFEVKNALCASLRNIPNLERLTTSWRSARTQPPLPAVVVDLRSVLPGEKLASGEVITNTHTLDISLHVDPQDRTDDECEADLEALMESFVEQVEAMYGKNYSIQDWWPHPVPWGNTGEALCGAFALVIEQ